MTTRDWVRTRAGMNMAWVTGVRRHAHLLLTIGGVAWAAASGTGMALAQTPAASGVGSPFELAFWQSVATSDDPAQYDAYLAQYPNGTFSGLARAKIAALMRARGTPLPSPQPAAPAPASPGNAGPPVAAPPPAPPPTTPLAVPAAPIPQPTLVPASAAPPPVRAAEGPPLNAFPALPAVPPPAPPPAAAPTPTPTSVPADPFAKLAALRAAQSVPSPNPPATVTPATVPMAASAPAAAARPGPPAMAALPAVDLPAQFCSAEARNRFHDEVYQPAVAIADRNNLAAIDHMDALQADYDARTGRGEIAAANALAREANAFRLVAQQAYAARTAFIALFERMMAVPIAACP